MGGMEQPAESEDLARINKFERFQAPIAGSGVSEGSVNGSSSPDEEGHG